MARNSTESVIYNISWIGGTGGIIPSVTVSLNGSNYTETTTIISQDLLAQYEHDLGEAYKLSSNHGPMMRYSA